MKKIILGALVFAAAFLSTHHVMAIYRYGQSVQGNQEKFVDFEYSLQGGSRTLSGNKALSGNATFYGYATDWSIKMPSAPATDPTEQVSVWFTAGSSNCMIGTTQYYYPGDNTYQSLFIVPADSPTIMNIQLQGQVTVYYSLGGFKRDLVDGDTRH